MKHLPLYALTVLLVACSSAEEETTPVVETNEPAPITTTATFADMLKNGKSLECNFSTTNDGETTIGTMWIDGSSQRMKGSFVRGNQTFNVIVANNTNYMWGSELENGISMNLEPGEAFADVANDEENTTVADVGLTDTMPIDFTCKKWFIDENNFIPPADVQFTDMSAMMKQMQNIVPNGNSIESACAVCNFLPEGEEKASCMTDLGCKE